MSFEELFSLSDDRELVGAELRSIRRFVGQLLTPPTRDDDALQEGNLSLRRIERGCDVGLRRAARLRNQAIDALGLEQRAVGAREGTDVRVEFFGRLAEPAGHIVCVTAIAMASEFPVVRVVNQAVVFGLVRRAENNLVNLLALLEAVDHPIDQ